MEFFREKRTFDTEAKKISTFENSSFENYSYLSRTHSCFTALFAREITAFFRLSFLVSANYCL